MALSPAAAIKLQSMLGKDAGKEIVDEINKMEDHSQTELDYLDGVIAGTSANNKAVVLDGTQEIDVISVVAGGFQIGTVAMTCTAAELNVLDAVTAGTATVSKGVVLDANGAIDVLGLSNDSNSGAVALRFGGDATEGLEVKVFEETVTLSGTESDLNIDMPAGAVILSVQAQVAVIAVAGGNTDRIAIGISGGDLDKYGETTNLTQDQKIDTIPDWAVLSGAEDVTINAVSDANGTVGDTGFSSGSVRVRIVYLQLNSLADA